MFTALADYLGEQARSADLVISGIDRSGKPFDSSRDANIGDLVMQLGRPALIVPPSEGMVNLGRVLIGWKDTRETRRAVLDALPLLKEADHVTVCEIASEDCLAAARTHLTDIVDWLKRNDIAAEPIAMLSTGDDTASLSAVCMILQGAGLAKSALEIFKKVLGIYPLAPDIQKRGEKLALEVEG
jgi:hypothetical protein